MRLSPSKMKIAIVHDWLVTYAGAERALEQILLCYPDADLFSTIDFFDHQQRDDHLLGKTATTTFVQKLPFAKKKYRTYLPLMPLAIEQLDLSSYDLVISISHAVAKGVITGPDQLHISYVCSPMRYAWDMQHQYLREANLTKGIKSFVARYILHKMRLWDLRTANGVDYFIGISNFIARRIQKIYRRDAAVIYPPVDVDSFALKEAKEDFYLTASRMVQYKKIDLIVENFANLPDKKLVVIGDGPEMRKIAKLATKNITLLGHQPFPVLRDYMQRAKAFVFAAEEDFGIAPLEAGACGTPVIAYGKGGALETIRGLDKENPTGLFFAEQTVDSLKSAIFEFEKKQELFSAISCRNSVLKFSSTNFREQFQNFVKCALRNY
jgi:glycosyltransferase involved in cell wall biosynthesis